MTREAAFTAELIRSSSRGLAGQTAALFYSRSGSPESPYGDEDFDSWRETIAARFEALAGALEAGEPKMFADDLLWFRGLSGTRAVPQEDLTLVIECMGDIVTERLPGEAEATTESYFAEAHQALQQPIPVVPGLAAGSAPEVLFDLAAAGDVAGAREFLACGIRDERLTLEQAIVETVLPAAREAGRRWHVGEINITTEHVITATLRRALHSLPVGTSTSTLNGKAAFLAAVPGDTHDTALVAFSILLEQDGWRVVLAGADTPADEIDEAAAAYHCDLIVLSVTMASQRHALTRYLHARVPSIPVLLGGAAIRDERDALSIGATAFAETLADGVRAARRILRLDPT